MAYVITRTTSGLKCVEGTTGEVRFFSTPVLKITSALQYPQNATVIDIRQGQEYLQLAVADITSINGVAQATIGSTLPPLLDALIAPAPGGNLTVQTAATGTNYTAFASTPCSRLTLFNGTGTSLDVQQGGAGANFTIPTGTSFTFDGLTNANQLGVRRTDTTNTQVTASARWQA